MFGDNYFASTYWVDRFWPGSPSTGGGGGGGGAGGYFADNFFAGNYWADRYFPGSPASGGGGGPVSGLTGLLALLGVGK